MTSNRPDPGKSQFDLDRLLQSGRFDESIALAQRAAAATPGDAAAWAVLAGVLFASRRPDAALQAWTRALALRPGDPVLLCGLANVLRSLSRIGEARALMLQALAADDASFDARFGLASLALEAGDWDQAEVLAAPLAGDLPQLAWLRARTALGRSDLAAARERTAALLEDRRLGPEQRADGLLMLSEALDGLDRTAEAFAAAVEGKAIQRRLYAQRAAGREAEVDKLRRLDAWFAAADPAAWRTAPAEITVKGQAAGHAFLLGFPRSGTTLLEQALAGHSRVVALEEAPTLVDAYDAFLSTPAGLERLARLSAEEAQAWRARYWQDVRTFGADVGGRLFLDKAPAGTLYLPLIAKLFPSAKVLFALRDPRDVTLSCLRNNFQINAMTYAFTDLVQTAACYDACMAMARTYRAMLSLDLLQVRHEALVQNFAGGLAAVASFLGLVMEPVMLDVAATARARVVRTPSAGQVRAGLSRRGLGRWRAYAPQLAPVMGTLAPWVARFGYEPD